MSRKRTTLTVDGKLKCNRCGEPKPLTEFTKASASPLGYKYTCKVCDYARESKRRARILAQRKANPPVYSQEPVQCTKCKEVKPRDQFTPELRNKIRGVKSHCHACGNKAMKGQHAKWRKINQANPPLQIGVQKCASCKHWLSYKRFTRDSGQVNGFRKVCKECCKAPMREVSLQRNFNISTAKYDQMYMQQGGRCKVCQKRETVKTKSGELHCLAVDHDHKTGKVRGLLCAGCNKGIGSLRDDVKILRSAADYLEEHDGK